MKKLFYLIQQELLILKRFNESYISWLLAFTGATVIVAPLVIGTALGQLMESMVVSMGTMVFLYFPKKNIHQRLNTLIIVTFGMQVSLLLGLLPPVTHWGMVPMIMLIVFLSLWLSRAYQLNAPGALYFIITGCVALIIPIPLSAIPKLLGLMAIGGIWAIIVALIYSLIFLRGYDNQNTIETESKNDFLTPVVDAFFIALAMGGAMSLAMLLNLQRPYWVPICCMTILQMPTLKLAWQRLWQMVLSSSLGLLLVWLIFLLPIDAWLMCLLLWVALVFTLWLLLRHYFLAMIFITPMTIFLVEFSVSLSMPQSDLIFARWTDILIGVSCGILGFYLINGRYIRSIKNKLIAKHR